MSPRRLTQNAARKFTTLIIIGMLVQLAVIGYVYASNRIDDHNRTISQRAGCERSKLDRQANAAFQRAHAEYITSITSANSVQADVKRAARKALITFERTSESLTERSKINCKEAYP